MMTYERYKELVPKETLEMTNKILLYLDHYKDTILFLKNNDSHCNDQYTKPLFIFLDVLSDNKEYKTLFSMNHYDENKLIFDVIKKPENVNYSELFSTYASYFLIFNSEIAYVSLTPLDLLIPVIGDYYSHLSYTYRQFDYVFSGYELSKFKKSVEDYNNQKKTEEEEKIEKKELMDFPLNVQSFLKTASRIRTELVVNYKDADFIVDIEKDSTPLSLLFALYYYEDLENDEYDITIKSIINDVLMKTSLDVDPANNTFGYGKSRSGIPTAFKPDLHTIVDIYGKYYEDGIYKGKPKKDVTVQGIIENVLNQDLNDTLVLKRIMNARKGNPDDFKDFCKLVDQRYQRERLYKERSYSNQIYDKLRNDSIEYLELATKIYTLIKEKMKDNKHNVEVLNRADDIDTLSLFIASFYFNLDVARFYKLYGITLDKVMEFLKLNISKEEIESTPLNKKILVDTFEKFISGGVSRNENREKLTPTNINHNLCDRDFNSSKIMEDIFYGLTDGEEISKDFLNQLKKELDTIDKKEKDKKCKELFEDMDVQTIMYLKKLAKVYSKMLIIEKRPKDVKTFSILFSLCNFEQDKTIIDTLDNNGLKLIKFFDTRLLDPKIIEVIKKDNDDQFDISDIDIDLLLKYFKDLIYDENNNKRSLIDIIKIIPSFCDSMTMKELYSRFGINSNLFTNIEEYIEKEIKRQKKYELESEAKNSLYISYNSSNVLDEAIRIIEYLKTLNLDKITIDELPDLSILLSFLNSSYKKYFESNGITLEKVCSILNINIEELKSFKTEIEYLPHLEEYKKYACKSKSNCNTFEEFKERFFIDNSVLDFIIDRLNIVYGDPVINKKVLETEVINDKPYIDSLSLEDRIQLLDSHQVDQLDINEIDSVLNFGNALAVHSKYIYDELPKLSSSDTCESSVAKIKELSQQVYDRRGERRGIFKKLFSSREGKLEIDMDALAKLRFVIDENNSILSEELKAYDKIRLYLEAYRKKNRQYLARANERVDEITAELETLDPANDEQYDRFVYLKGLLEIMKNKVNRFDTTNIMARQDLSRISLATVNHSIIINTLEMAKNDLFPLIIGQLALSKGLESEKNAIELSKNVIGLFQALIAGNIEGTKQNLELIKQSQIPLELLQSIDSGVSGYLETSEGLKKAKELPTLNVRKKRSEE